MQRIVERGQIESLTHGQFKRYREPRPQELFATRAQRLRTLSNGHSLAGYLRLMAQLADAQHTHLKHLRLDDRAQDFVRSDSPLDADALDLLPWQSVLAALCEQMLRSNVLPNARDIARDLAAAAQSSTNDEMLTQQARAILACDSGGIDRARAPFIMAALQVCWTWSAAERITSTPPVVGAQNVCPICTQAPVASIVAIDGDAAGFRFLHCSLCSTQWHYVRAQCSQCGSGKRLSYQGIEGASGAVRAECCDECSTYLKLLYPEHDPDVEPVADDLATLPLDILLSTAGYSRAGSNPLYWQA